MTAVSSGPAGRQTLAGRLEMNLQLRENDLAPREMNLQLLGIDFPRLEIAARLRENHLLRLEIAVEPLEIHLRECHNFAASGRAGAPAAAATRFAREKNI